MQVLRNALRIVMVVDGAIHRVGGSVGGLLCVTGAKVSSGLLLYVLLHPFQNEQWGWQEAVFITISTVFLIAGIRAVWHLGIRHGAHHLVRKFFQRVVGWR